MSDRAALIGRILVALIFVVEGATKAFDFEQDSLIKERNFIHYIEALFLMNGELLQALLPQLCMS